LPPPITAEQVSRDIVVTWPGGAALPDDFVHQDWSSFHLPWVIARCLGANNRCGAVLADLDGDGIPEVMLFDMPNKVGITGTVNVLHKAANGRWMYLGPLSNVHCPGVGDALAAGHVDIAEPQFKELAVNGQRLRMNVDCGPMP
jgi:hypothetical protein